MSYVGYSEKINDPAFTKYYESTKRYSWIFAWILAIAFTLGFLIYGETSKEMDNPQALFIGIGLGLGMLLIAFFTNRSRARTRTWDGVVIDHKIKQKKRKVYRTGNDYYWEEFQEFIVIIQESGGKLHEIISEDDDTLYRYYAKGDNVRHHARLNTYEKYDKSKDNIIFCNACATMNEITEDFCFRCKCPLLK
jgi:hypothetical protein